MKHSRLAIFGVMTAAVIGLGQICGGASVSDGGIFKSVDRGQTWEQKVFVSQQGRKTLTISDLNTTILSQDPSNPANIFIGTEADGMFFSGNGGDQWGQVTQINTGKVRGIVFDPLTPTTLYVLRDNQILKSIDAGTTWETIYTETSGKVMVFMDLNRQSPNILFAGLEHGKIIRSTDGGVNWSVILAEPRQPILRVLLNPTSPNIMYALEREKDLWRSSDNGVTWEKLYNHDHILQVAGAGRPLRLIMDTKNPSTIYLIAENIGLIRSDDNGDNWTLVNTLVGRDADTMTAFLVDPSDSNTLWLGVGHFIHVSYDRGATWTVNEAFPSTRDIVFFSVDQQDSTLLYAGTRAVEEEGGLFGPK